MTRLLTATILERPGERPSDGRLSGVDGELIQDRDGVEMPSAGRWPIASGQQLTAKRPGRRSGRVDLLTTGGVLQIPSGRSPVRFVLLARSDGPAMPRSVVFVGELASADRLGRWQVAGFATVDGVPRSPLRLAVTYQGVYRHGARPVAWLTIDGAVSSPSWQSHLRRRAPAEAVHLLGDLNLHREIR